jgi:hypothetical protein
MIVTTGEHIMPPVLGVEEAGLYPAQTLARMIIVCRRVSNIEDYTIGSG